MSGGRWNSAPVSVSSARSTRSLPPSTLPCSLQEPTSSTPNVSYILMTLLPTVQSMLLTLLAALDLAVQPAIQFAGNHTAAHENVSNASHGFMLDGAPVCCTTAGVHQQEHTCV
jgi:hypothetical protein